MIQGDRLRRLREQAAMTQTRLGVLIGQDQQYVSKLERGVLQGMTVETLERLCRALQVSTDYLLDFSWSAPEASSTMDPLPAPRRARTATRGQGRTAPRAPEQSEASPVAVISPPEPQQQPAPAPQRAPGLCPYCALTMQPLGEGERVGCPACRYSREA